MAARFKKPSSGADRPVIPQDSPYKAEPWWKNTKKYGVRDLPTQEDMRLLRTTRAYNDYPAKEPDYKLSIKDYIRYSPSIAKDLLKESPFIAMDLIDPLGSESRQKIADVGTAEANRAWKGGLQPQQIGPITMGPKMAAIARMVPGLTDALTSSNWGSMYSTNVAAKALKKAMGLSEEGLTKEDLIWLGLMYGHPIKSAKGIYKGISRLIP